MDVHMEVEKAFLITNTANETDSHGAKTQKLRANS
jgi:hypothetical protein